MSTHVWYAILFVPLSCTANVPAAKPAPAVDAPAPEAEPRPVDHIVAELLAGELRLERPDERVRQCNLLIDKISTEQAPLKTSGSDPDPDALRQMAGMLTKVADAVAAVRADDADIVRFRDDYAKMTRELSAATLRTAEALERTNSKEAADAAHTMSEFGPREGAIVNAINAYCQTAYAKPDEAAEADCLKGKAGRCLAAGAYHDSVAPIDEERALDLYQRGCSGGDARSCATAADAYLAGRGTARDEGAAVELHARGCKLGVAYSCSMVGERLWMMNGRTPEREDAARRLWTSACAAGEASGCQHLLEHAGAKQVETREVLDGLCKKGAERACEALEPH